jgi:hypothetical protein
MGEKMTFSEDVDVIRLLLEFRYPYSLKSLYNPFYDVRVDRVERVQRRFIRYALRGLGWTNMHDLPSYEDRCAH